MSDTIELNNEVVKVTDLGTVQSSGGELTINCSTGKVLQIHCFDEDYREQFEAIEKFDMNEWHKHYPFDQQCTHFDILDLGYWKKEDGYKVEPDWDFRKNSHWDRVYELKQILIEEVMLHIQSDMHENSNEEPVAVMLNKLPIPDLYSFLPEHHLHDEKFKYLIDQELTFYSNQHQDTNDYYGIACPQCRTPLNQFDMNHEGHDRFQCDKCKVLITVEPFNENE